MTKKNVANFINLLVFAGKQKHVKKYFCFAFFVYLSFMMMSLLLPFVFGTLVDYVIPSESRTYLVYWVIIAVGIIFFYQIYNALIFQYLYTVVEEKTFAIAEKWLIKYFLQMKVYNYEKNPSGKLLNLVKEDLRNALEIVFQLINWSGGIIIIIVMFVFIYSVYPLVALVMFLFIPLYVFTLFANGKKLQEAQVSIHDLNDKRTTMLNYIIDNKRVINSFSAEDVYINAHDELTKNRLKAKFNYYFWYHLTNRMPMMMSNASQYIAMFIAAFAVMDNTITLGMLFVMSSYIGSSSMPLEGLTYLLVRINASSQLFSRLNEYIVKVESKDEYDTMVIDKLIEQKIQIYKTSICNPSGETLFYIDQLTIDKPGLYQLAGVNGSGKTTLINLITNNAHSDGFCIHENGYVKINKNIVNNTAHYYSSNLFISGSVKENIVINHTYDQNHFEKITMLLNIDFLDKQVDPNNLNLSLGESAKISLARIFIKNHELILLDEPFTNIDINTTKKLVNYIKKLSEKCPIIVISHDDSVKSICEHYFEIVDKKLINR